MYNNKCVLVRRRRSLQGWNQRVPHSWTGRKWLLRGGSASYPNTHWNHHYGNPHPGSARRKGTSHPRVDLCGPKKIQLPRTFCWVVCWEGCNSGFVRYCTSRIVKVQAYWGPRCQEGVLRCVEVHHGVRSQRWVFVLVFGGLAVQK